MTVTTAVGDQLDRGGGGVVYTGPTAACGRTVAVKVLSHRTTSNDPVRVQAFVEEAIITGGLEHPNIVPAYDLGCSPTLGLYYTMKRLTGRPLSQIIDALHEGDPATTHSFGMYRLLGSFIELCRAVAYAHAPRGAALRPRPENAAHRRVRRGRAGRLGPGAGDGAAGRADRRAAHMHAGTPEYMAPEQITKAGHDLDVRSDIWSLGVILYEILTLTQPFQGANAKEVLMRVMVEQLEPPSRRAPNRPIPLASRTSAAAR